MSRVLAVEVKIFRQGLSKCVCRCTNHCFPCPSLEMAGDEKILCLFFPHEETTAQEMTFPDLEPSVPEVPSAVGRQL